MNRTERTLYIEGLMNAASTIDMLIDPELRQSVKDPDAFAREQLAKLNTLIQREYGPGGIFEGTEGPEAGCSVPPKYEELGLEVGQLVDEKQAAYGNSFGKAGDFLKLCYPVQILPEQYNDALALVRIFDKQMRIAHKKDALGESPFKDIAGYGLLGEMEHRREKEKHDSNSLGPKATAKGIDCEKLKSLDKQIYMSCPGFYIVASGVIDGVEPDCVKCCWFDDKATKRY